MIIYIVMYIIILVSGIVYEENKDKKNAKKIYCIFVALVLLFFSWARNEKLGNSDTVNMYIPRFNLVQKLSFYETFLKFIETEPVFYLITKIITMISTNINFYFMLCAIPLIAGVTKLIYKYSEMPVLSCFMFLGLGYYFISYITLRNSIALGILLFSLDYLIQRKLWKFLLVVIIASLFHSSALFFIMAYPITFFDFKINLKWISIFLLFVIMIIFKDFFINIFFIFIKNSHLLLYKDRNVSLSLTLFVEYLLLFISTLPYRESYYEKNKKEANTLYILTYMGALLALLVVMQDVMYRVSTFYYIYIIILLPNCINMIIKEKYKWVLSIIVMIFFVVLGLKYVKDINLIPYKAFFFGG